MADEIKMWAIDASSGEVVKVASTNRTDTEQLLEDTLAANPEMLMPGLSLVGRQVPTTGGPLDLLGIDSNGQLVLFELKRGTLTRDAVTQVIDYGSALESSSEDEIVSLILEHGWLDIKTRDDFDEWHNQHSDEQQPPSLKPIQMVLVGLGIDDKASRMVDFLAKQGVQITLLTFYGYVHEGKTLLARQTRIEPGAVKPPTSATRKERRVARENAALERVRELGTDGLFNEITEGFDRLGSHRRSPLTDGYTFYRDAIRLPGVGKFNSPYSIRFMGDGKIRITFSPMAVHLCEERFNELNNNQTINFLREKPHSYPPTPRVSVQWYCVLDEEKWREHKETLLDLGSAVYAAWNEGPQDED